MQKTNSNVRATNATIPHVNQTSLRDLESHSNLAQLCDSFRNLWIHCNTFNFC